MLIVPELVAQPMPIVDAGAARLLRRADAGLRQRRRTCWASSAEPTFSVPHGFYTTTQSVAIATPTPGAIIVYTTNGSTPHGRRQPERHQRHALHRPDLDLEHDDAAGRGVQGRLQAVVRRGQHLIFVNDVINQSPAGQVPAGWAPNGVNGQEINYGIDPDIINLYGATAVKDSLLVAADDLDHHRPGEPVQPDDRHLRQRRTIAAIPGSGRPTSS